MSTKKEGTANNLERHVLKRAKSLQHRLIESEQVFVSENADRQREAFGQHTAFLIPGDDRIRHHRYKGELFLKSYRKVNKQANVRWSKPEDVEAGIRMADHVREAYDPQTGREIEKTHQVVALVHSLSVAMQQEGVKPLDMQKMAEDAASQLTEAGFINAQKDSRVDTVEKIMRAANLDSRKRVNTPRSRMIVSHVWVDLIRELLVGKMTENKYSRIGAKLIREREFERFLMFQTLAHIAEMDGVTSSFEDARSSRELKMFIGRYLSRDVIKLKPYAKMAARVRFLIMNTGTEEELSQLRQYIGEEADMYRGTPPFTKLEGPDKKRRLQGVRQSLVEGLEVAELFLHTETSKREQALENYLRGK